MNSGPLSERMWPGTPRRMDKSESTSMTSMALSLRATRIAKHSCVNSSMTLSIRNLRLSCNRAYRVGNALPLRHQHINLAQLRNNLLGLVSLPRHRGPPSLESHTSGRTTSKGEDHPGAQ